MATKTVYPNHTKHYVLVTERWRDDRYFGLVRLGGYWRKTRAEFLAAEKAQAYSFALADRALRLARATRMAQERRSALAAQQTQALRRVAAVVDMEASWAGRLCRLCERVSARLEAWMRASMWPRVYG